MTYRLFCKKSNTTGATNGAETAYPSGAPEVIAHFNRCWCSSILSFYVVFSRSFLAIVLSVVGSYCIGGEMVSVLASNAVDRGFERRSGQTKDY